MLLVSASQSEVLKNSLLDARFFLSTAWLERFRIFKESPKLRPDKIK